MFEEIEWHELSTEYSEGIYDGRKFILLNGDEFVEVEGNFTDDERRYIATQWEMAI